MRSLSLRPDDLLTIPWMALSINSMRFRFLRACDPSYRALTFPLVGLPPTEHISLLLDIPCRRHYPGRIDGTDSLMTAPSTSAFPTLQLGRLLHYIFRGLLSVHSRYNLQTRQVALCDLLRSDCYRVERSSSRAGLTSRCGPAPFHGAL
jgi:hypothetical protein